jgi:uncharacterized protein YukE
MGLTMLNVYRPSHGVGNYKMFPWLEGIVVALVVTLAICTTAYFIYARSLDAVEAEIKEGLQRTAAAVATQLDGDAHRKYNAKIQKDDPALKAIYTHLEEARQATKHVRYMYTNILAQDAVYNDNVEKVYFIWNASPQNDNDKDGKPDEAPQLMDPYPEASASLLRALKEHVVTVDEEPYTDQWGTFISAYAPFYDSKGKFVGTLGMDLELTGFNERLEPVLKATKRAGITGIVVAILCGTAVWFLRRFARQLNAGRHQLAHELEEAKTTARTALDAKSDFLVGVAESVHAQLGASPPDTTTLQNFVEQTAYYARLEANREPLNTTDFNLRERIEHVVAQAKTQAGGRPTLSLQIANDIPTILHGDHAKIEQVFNTVLSCICRYTSGATLHVDIGMQEEMINFVWLHVRIVDSGHWLHDAERESLFEPFPSVRHHVTGHRGPLPHLSLAIARLLVRLMRGDLQVHTDPDKGTGFEFNVFLSKAVAQNPSG